MDIGKALLFLINIEGSGPPFSSLVIYLGHKQDISCVTEAQTDHSRDSNPIPG